MSSNKLELAALQQRAALIPLNSYNSSDQSQKYSATHPNALSDGDNKGKGTSTYLDTYNGGASADINGNPNYAGSGRLQNVAFNQYNSNNGYEHPDTSGNIGQVVI
jgi:hypothetical protein